MTIHNPLPIQNIGDPYILRVQDTYYLYATSHFNGFYAWQSRNLQDWSEPVTCYEAGEKSFGNSCFWAPEVYRFDGRYYMYYTAQWAQYEDEALRIGVAVADSPLGPFEEVFDRAPMFDFGYGALDAHVFTDDDGSRYLYYSRAGSGNYVNGVQEADIHVIRLGADHVSVEGEARLIVGTDQPWEVRSGVNQHWNEGPFVLKHEGLYHLMYSADFFATKHYCVGGAVADNPMGPFVKYEENPILSYVEGKVSGPGHNSVVADPQGSLYCVYHAHTDYNSPGGDRQVYIDPMVFENGRIKVLGPTVGSESKK